MELSIKTFKIQAFILSIASLIVFTITGIDIFLLREALFAFVIFSTYGFFEELPKKNKATPINLMTYVVGLNSLVLALGIFVEIFISKESSFLGSLITFLYHLSFIPVISFMALSFRKLYFKNQKKDDSIYFRTMITFFVLFLVSSVLPDNFKFLYYAFMVMSIILIVINSVKISWIALISKRDKLLSLALSVIIIIIISFNWSFANNTYSEKTLQSFSNVIYSAFNLAFIYGLVYFINLFFTALFHIPTAEAIDRKTREMTSLQDFSNLINQVLDFNDLAETITGIASKITSGSACFILWFEKEESKTIARQNIGLIDSNNIVNYVAQDRHFNKSKSSIVSLSKYEGKSFFAAPFNTVLTTPIKSHSEVKGIIFSIKNDGFIFDEEDINAMNTFADYASVVAENSRLLQESIEKERMEKELDVAREIQRKILPGKNPDFDKLSIASTFIPAFEVGGDYYDFFDIPYNKLGFIIADVSGKGISAAFIMAELKGIFETLSGIYKSPKELLIKANSILKKTLTRNTFVSAAYGIIDFEKDTLTISRAGHCPVIIVRNNRIISLQPAGMGMGLNFTDYFGSKLEELTINLYKDDLIVLYTDGITEAKNLQMDDYGNLPFEKILIENSTKNVDEISNEVIKDVTLYSRDISQFDDITLVILKWNSGKNLNGDEGWQNSVPLLKSTEM